MIKALLVGQHHWAKHLAALINARAAGVQADAVDGAKLFSPRSLKLAVEADIFMRVGFRPAATTPLALAFEVQWDMLRAVLNSSARTIYYWIGSDVLFAVEDAHSGRLCEPRWRRACGEEHLVGAPWFAGELRPLGIEATSILFPSKSPEFANVPPLPEAFTILTYIPDARHSFYGGEAVYRCAQRFPQVSFRVLGGEGNWVRNPLPNLEFLGWQEDIRPILADASVVLRLVPHDALGGTVREALAAGRTVIYTYPLPHTHHVHWGDEDSLLGTIAMLYQEAISNGLKINYDAINYARQQFDPTLSVDAIIAHLSRKYDGVVL